eukprot:scaffold192628_cov25-Prasinocladus_malaysianus.AAC.1
MPTPQRYDLRLRGPGIARLSRNEWRQQSGALDEGEWVGFMTICVFLESAIGLKSPPGTERMAFSLMAFASSHHHGMAFPNFDLCRLM